MGKKPYLWIIIFLGLVLRLININQSFWLDEATQAQISSWSINLIWNERGGDFHPPLFYLLSHYWLFLGKSEIWLRLLPLTFGLAAIPIMYLLGTHLFSSKKVGLLAALFLAVSPFHIYYSQEFRSYSLLMLLALLSMYFFVKNRQLPLLITNILMLYTHYSAFYLLVVQVIIHLFIYKRSFFSLLVHYALLFLGFLPWLPQFVTQLKSGGNAEIFLPGWSRLLSISPLKALPVIIFKLVAGRIDFLYRPIYYLYIVFVLCTVFFVLGFSQKQRNLLYVWIFVPIFLITAFSVFLPQAQPFRLIFVLPAIIFCFAQVAIRFPKLVITLFIYISLVGNLTYYTRPRLQREQWREAINFLESVSSSNTLTILKFTAPFAPFYWYAPQFPVYPAQTVIPSQPQDVSPRIFSAVQGKSVVFVLDYLGEITDPSRIVDLTLQNLGFAEYKVYDFPGVGFIREYHKSL